MGGRGNTGTRSTGTRPYSSFSDIEQMEIRDRAKYEAYSYQRDHLLAGSETSVSNVQVEKIGDIDKDGMADVVYSYDVHVRFSEGWDAELNREIIGHDIESRRDTRRLKIRR